jgi:hypothetical protein
LVCRIGPRPACGGGLADPLCRRDRIRAVVGMKLKYTLARGRNPKLAKTRLAVKNNAARRPAGVKPAAVVPRIAV